MVKLTLYYSVRLVFEDVLEGGATFLAPKRMADKRKKASPTR